MRLNSNYENFTGISVRFLGEAYTSWNERIEYKRSDGETEYRYQLYYGEQQFFHRVVFLLGSYDAPETSLFSGVHDFPFNCVLPDQIPPSFDNDYGYVRYTIKATLRANWRPDENIEVKFFVRSQVDLSKIPGCLVSS